ncbi:zinc finger, CCHC-type containing protein [Tanacetum coccineum]
MAGNTVKDMTTNFGKLDKFEGHDFRRWQKKMHFLLTTLKVVYVLTTPMPELVEDARVEAIRIRAKWENDDYICRGQILNGMSDSLFDAYTNVESAKELWDSLESKYMAEDYSNDSLWSQDCDKGKGKEVAGHLVNMIEMRVMHIEWWIGSWCTSSVCKDRCWFKTFETVEDGSVLYMGDDHFAPVHGKGSNQEMQYLMRTVSLQYLDQRMLYQNSVECQRDDHSDDVPIFSCGIERSKLDHSILLCYSIRRKLRRTYDKAMQSRDATFWKEAIDDEIGFSQRKGSITSIPMHCCSITTISLLLALIAIPTILEGFCYATVRNEHKVCKLVKSLYGLKQAPKQWHQKFDEVVLSSGFLLNQSDKCVYSKYDGSGKGVIICLYVDDMLIFGTDQNQVDKTKKFLSSKFSMKDMGEADVILGIKIKRENKGIVITQSHYIEKILKKFNRENCSPVSTPMDPVEKLMPNTGKPVDQLEYSRAIGCLMYAMTSTRPDIAYAVGRLSRFTSNPSRHHWHAITRVFKYLKGTMNYGLSYVGYPSVLEGYSDASWINHVEDSSSTSGWVFLLGGGAISWASKKQTCITGSTMESEFVALAAAGKEAEWLRNLIHEIPIWPHR